MSGSQSAAQGGTIRTYGRVTDPENGARFWVEVGPDANGWNDTIYLTTLVQCCKLNWGESPFYGDWGIPAHQSVMQQVPPDYYMSLMQQRFAPRFMALLLTRVSNEGKTYWDAYAPTYRIDVQFHGGAKISTTVIPMALVDGFGVPVVGGHGYPVSVGVKHGTYVAT